MNKKLLIFLLCIFWLLSGCTAASTGTVTFNESTNIADNTTIASNATESIEYVDSPFIVLGDNTPDFTENDYTVESFEIYSELDSLGRCGYAFACIGLDLMPTEARESISQVIPSGWINNSYDFVDGGYLYNRCHLIGFQLTGENANKENLITGTRYLNVEGMLPFENMVADYIKETNNHVLYRVTPVFEEDNLVAKGVQMEAWSVEDQGAGICFNVFCFNIQPGVFIDYKTGNNFSVTVSEDDDSDSVSECDFILNVNSHKFHDPTCGQAKNIVEKNRYEYFGDRQDLIEQGYEPAGCCNP